jgi:hypothetical protein
MSYMPQEWRLKLLLLTRLLQAELGRQPWALKVHVRTLTPYSMTNLES